METYQGSDYVDCPKCGVNHSKLVKHRCFKPKGQDKPPEFDEFENEGDGSGYGGEDGKGKGGGSDRDGQGQKGSGQGDGQGQGEGDGEGEGEDDGEGQGQGQAPEPQPPEPEAPPVVVVCTVMKFAALTAQCAKNGNIEITLADDGLFIYGHNGDNVAFDVIPWGEFEQRATLDGEFYVKEVIDRVDEKLADPKTDGEALARAVDKAKAEQAEAKTEAPKKKGAGRKAKPKKADALTLPLTVGQRVRLRDGQEAKVVTAMADSAVASCHPSGVQWTYQAANGLWLRSEDEYDTPHPYDIVADIPPLIFTVGKRYQTRGQGVVTLTGIRVKDGLMAITREDGEFVKNHCYLDGRCLGAGNSDECDGDLIAEVA